MLYKVTTVTTCLLAGATLALHMTALNQAESKSELQLFALSGECCCQQAPCVPQCSNACSASDEVEQPMENDENDDGDSVANILAVVMGDDQPDVVVVEEEEETTPAGVDDEQEQADLIIVDEILDGLKKEEQEFLDEVVFEEEEMDLVVPENEEEEELDEFVVFEKEANEPDLMSLMQTGSKLDGFTDFIEMLKVAAQKLSTDVMP